MKLTTLTLTFLSLFLPSALCFQAPGLVLRPSGPAAQCLSRPNAQKLSRSAAQRRQGGAVGLRAVVPPPPGTVFEAQPPPLGPTIAVFTTTFGLAGYWWLVFVPSERRDLAKEKNKGGLNAYLDDLETSAEGERGFEKWFYTEWLNRRRKVRKMAEAKAAKGEAETDAEREERIEQEIERAIPMPNFISLDNPILIAVALAFTGALAFGGLGR